MRRLGIFTGAFCLLALIGGGLVERWIQTTELPGIALSVSPTVEDRNGDLLRAFTIADGRWRLPVALDEVDPGYIAQLIAFEDKRYYHHGGGDVRAMIRATVQALWRGEIVSGGSTLTMQVARLLEQGGTGSWQGKLRQMRVALALERQLGKDDILNLYLLLAPYGGNIEGVRAASLTYFRKEPRRLTDAEAALLVALPQSPERRRPDRRIKAAHAARERVLNRMVGAHVLAPDAAQAALREEIPAQRNAFPNHAPHLSERVILTGAPGTTHRLSLDRTVQSAVETLVKSYVLPRHASLSAAVLIVDHRTGEIVTSVGAPDYLDQARSGFLDMTLAVRSPGSALKPLIYGLAFESGRAHPETIIDDRPSRFGTYAPQNFDNQFRGEVRIRKALQMSLNIPAVALLQEVGPPQLIARIQRAGAVPRLPTDEPPGLAIALGGLGISLKDMVAIYAAIARGGEPVEMTYKVKSGVSVAQRQPVLGSLAAWYVADILAGMPPPDSASRNVLAYKTGTSYGHRDAWALGFDGRHTIGVWLGRPDGAAMPGELGRDLAAPLLFESFALLKPTPDPLPVAPDAALTGTTAQLPTQLQHFRSGGALTSRLNNPKIAFPPDGARIDLGEPVGEDAFLALKVANGAPPFTWLANGRPVEVASFERQTVFVPDGPGHLSISVIDAKGQSQQVEVVLE
ncbi:MAG: penicillin-binding protein 1C [Rhodobacteraceae bacterium]|nr:penicillin-binding protein 1C [Paracoccaceae bacterium]